jgi:2-polyprenyl-3-methyl-5-hydroxy-6-metoxy-1,4-benzoquinol methylase
VIPNYEGAARAWLDLTTCETQVVGWASDKPKNDIEYFVADKAREWNCRSILDVGCGGGRFAQVMDFDQFLGIDQSINMVMVAEKLVKKPGASFIRARAEEILIPENFDLGIAMHVLQHLKDPEMFMRRMFQNFFCKRWCFTVLMTPKDEIEYYNIGSEVAACARPLIQVTELVEALPFAIEDYEIMQSSGVPTASEVVFYGRPK